MSDYKKIITIVGARPQFIKAAAVSRAIAGRDIKLSNCAVVEKIVHTGQHYNGNMSKVFFDELEIPWPDYNLGVGSGSHGKQTGKMLERIERTLVMEKPHWVLVYGDTNSTLAGALVAAKLHISVAHIEAGLRSFNRRMPEEINRVLTDHISDLLFCPTETAVKNLANEGISEGVFQAGDVMYDSVLFYAKKVKTIEREILERLNLRQKSYYLATVHRAENTDDNQRLQNIFEGLAAISTPQCPIVLPLHPRTRRKIAEVGLTLPDRIKIAPPISYLKMLALERNARAILTDSGGVQKEAYWFRVPCITLRDETEWIETVESGWNVLTGAKRQRIVDAVKQAESNRPACNSTLYGDGHSAEAICRILLEFAGK